MGEQDIRWKQRFSNYQKALEKLKQAVNYINENELDDSIQDEIILEGLVQRFEYTQELAWKVMKDYLEYQGGTNIIGSRDAVRKAFKAELITDGSVWMSMIESRNRTSHTYDEDTAKEIANYVLNAYYPAFVAFEKRMIEEAHKE